MDNNLNNVLSVKKEFKKITTYLNRGEEGLVYGVDGSSISLLTINLQKAIKDNILIITANKKEADELYYDLSNLVGESKVFLFQSFEVLPHELLPVSKNIKAKRLETLNKLLIKKEKIYITTVESLLQYLPNRKEYYEQIKPIREGQEVEIKTFLVKLVKMGYQRVKKVSEPGQFSLRGGIVDIYPLGDEAIRIELFGDEIDSIRKFNPLTQRSDKNLKQAILYPAQELIQPTKEDYLKQIREDLKDTAVELSTESKAKLEEITKEDLEKLKEGISFSSERKYINYFYEISTLFDYFSGTVLCLDLERIRKKARNFLTQIIERYDKLLTDGKVLKSYKDLFIDFDELFTQIEQDKIYLAATKKKLSLVKPDYRLEFKLKRPESFQGKVNLLIKQVKEFQKQGYKIVIALSSISKAEKLKNRLKDNNLAAIVVEEIDDQLKAGNIILTNKDLKQGVLSNELKFVLYTEKELLKNKRNKSRKRKSSSFKKGAPISSFTELNEGDYVVHENHGIAQYVGVERLTIQNKNKDYLLLLYKNDDKLYVPTDKIDLIQKYIALKDRKPKLNKLEGDSWQKAKSRVEKSVEEMAEELLDLYAKREMKEGYAFSEDTVWQEEFEAAFPYQETNDQQEAIETVKSDMESLQPMDRLICGDVGYGKTEVAIRAIFKAIMDGKQAAFLVPTTILAQQHWSNIEDRFSKYPINVEMLSRFRTSAEQRKVIKALKEGRVDLVIGTHRLLSQDISFNDLGLLVVDEEQRFGVKQKERLKKFKASIDVLTLSATPIPRTLHMSLVGVRDISLIETPPENRSPIRTFVGEYNNDLVQEAIYRELNRGGQVYFVHNRVRDIKEKANKIASFFPEAKVAVAHGQMNEKKLEEIMFDFLAGEYDILVCTTIIENGMDIGNVNTIIINRADKMGLSQLYQLKGRVGRSNKVAYAYLLHEEDKILSQIAEKRLKAINEFTDLGSGFKIAMRDLEIRGAGNILGPEQHGHIEAVGFSLYCKLLEDAIDKLKNNQQEDKLKCKLELKVNAYLPSEYINDAQQKIEIYKKVEQIESEQDYNQLANELEDRFGPLSKEVNLLLDMAWLKNIAAEFGFYEIKEKKNKLEFKLDTAYLASAKKLMEVAAEFDNFKVIAGKKPGVEADITDYSDQDKCDLILKFLTSLKEKKLKEKTG